MNTVERLRKEFGFRKISHIDLARHLRLGQWFSINGLQALWRIDKDEKLSDENHSVLMCCKTLQSRCDIDKDCKSCGNMRSICLTGDYIYSYIVIHLDSTNYDPNPDTDEPAYELDTDLVIVYGNQIDVDGYEIEPII